MDFTSAYAHGFARVAACTLPVSIADPASNAEAVLAEARACHDDGVAVAIFPELCLSGYAIEDLVLQDPLLDAVREAIETHRRGAARDLRPVLVVGAPIADGNRVYNCAVVIHRGEVLGVAPKSYLPTYREFYERRWYAPGDDRRGHTIRLGDREVPVRSRPALPGHRRARASSCTSRSARTCGCRCRRAPRRRSPGATVLANISGSPITVARAEDRRLLVAVVEPALPRGVRLRRRRARASRAPTCRGTARR